MLRKGEKNKYRGIPYILNNLIGVFFMGFLFQIDNLSVIVLHQSFMSFGRDISFMKDKPMKTDHSKSRVERFVTQ